MTDQGAAFADRLAKAVQESEQSTKSPASASALAKQSEDAKLKAT
ncbi:MAG: hypothetical protein K0R55_1910, partial [Sporomusa sp.]|nr:hypothetical protein [Sporomusa sp.]